jgi:hypothetical protein
MHKNAMKCNKIQSKWCINKHRASKIIDTFGTYQCPAGIAAPVCYTAMEGRSMVVHLLGRVVLWIGRGREPDGWCVREEEEERPLIKEQGAVRVANGTKRCACVSGAWTRHHGEPMKRT